MPKPENIIYSLKEENVDIYTLPVVDCPPPNSTLVLGDSHGRFTKLMNELLRYCVINNITASQYQDLVSLQQKSGDELSREDLTLFTSIMKTIVVNLTLKIILIDDFVADRGDADERDYQRYKGGNDYLNLKFLEVLSKAKIILGICYSNHGIELINAYERGLNFTVPRFEKKYHSFFNTVLQLQRLIDRNLVDRITEINPLIKEHYIAHLNVLIYYRDLLVTHAPAGLKQIEALAKQFNVSHPYDINSPEFKTCNFEKDKLLQMVNEINGIFKNHAQAGTIHKIHDYYNYTLENMLDFFTHNRKRTGLQRSECLYQANGHDTDTESLDPPGVFTLNSPLGQGRCPEKTCIGTNRVLIISPEQQAVQPSDEQTHYHELWNSICDIYSSMASAGANAFITGAALSLFGKLLEKYTDLEQQQINQFKSAVSGILIVYGMFLSESDQLQMLIWNLIIGYIVRSMPNIAEQNSFVTIAATSTTVGMAIAASSSSTWASFFSNTLVRATSSISAYYGYSLGSTLFASPTVEHQNEPKPEPEPETLRKENDALKAQNKILVEKLTATKQHVGNLSASTSATFSALQQVLNLDNAEAGELSKQNRGMSL